MVNSVLERNVPKVTPRRAKITADMIISGCRYDLNWAARIRYIKSVATIKA